MKKIFITCIFLCQENKSSTNHPFATLNSSKIIWQTSTLCYRIRIKNIRNKQPSLISSFQSPPKKQTGLGEGEIGFSAFQSPCYLRGFAQSIFSFLSSVFNVSISTSFLTGSGLSHSNNKLHQHPHFLLGTTLSYSALSYSCLSKLHVLTVSFPSTFISFF